VYRRVVLHVPQMYRVQGDMLIFTSSVSQPGVHLHTWVRILVLGEIGLMLLYELPFKFRIKPWFRSFFRMHVYAFAVAMKLRWRLQAGAHGPSKAISAFVA
jgi:hypothetical protein